MNIKIRWKKKQRQTNTYYLEIISSSLPPPITSYIPRDYLQLNPLPTTCPSYIFHLHLNPFQNFIYHSLLNLKPYLKPNYHHSILNSWSPTQICLAPEPTNLPCTRTQIHTFQIHSTKPKNHPSSPACRPHSTDPIPIKHNPIPLPTSHLLCF